MSRKRTPSDDELALWQKVAETAKPLRSTAGRTKKEPKPPPKPAPPAPSRPQTPKPAAPKQTAAKPTLPKPPPLAALDRRTRGRVARGSIEIDRRLDLHGMTQDAAHGRLESFLRNAQADGARLVLVITGKGRAAGAEAFDRGGGVLRRAVPQWLSASDLRSVVVGFEEAAPHHGGGGALYVRIRRTRD